MVATVGQSPRAAGMSHPERARPDAHPATPDGRYFVVRGRLWRLSNPALPPERRDTLVKALMDARRALRRAGPGEQRSHDARAAARQAVEQAKRALGERGPVWWTDGAPDYNRKMVVNTPYAEWYKGVGKSREGVA